MVEQKKLIRTFIALDVDEISRQKFSELITQLKKEPYADKVKWVPAENLHITLKFLGDVAEEKILAIKQMLAEQLSTVAVFELELGRVITFPPAVAYAHTLVLSFPITKELALLVRQLEEKLQQQGFALEERPYLPHLTLGRLRERFNIDVSKFSVDLPEKLLIDTVTLYRSDSSEQGSIYTALQKFKLI